MTNIILAIAASAGGMLRSILRRSKNNSDVTDTSTIRKLTRAIAVRQFEIDWLLATREPNTAPAQSIKLLQKISSSPASAFACYLNPTGEVVQLSEAIQDSLLRLTGAGRSRLSSEAPVELKRSHHHWSNFRNPQAIPEHCWAFPCGAPGNPTGWIVTSHIPALTEDQETDRAVLEKLCRATHIRAYKEPQSFTRQSKHAEFDENQLVRDMFQLRLLADEEFGTPEEMLQEFLSKLAFLSAFDRASLYSRKHAGSIDFQCWTCGGQSISPSINKVWGEVEQKILQNHASSAFRVWLTPEEHPVIAANCELKFQSVLIVPMDQVRFPDSVLLLTSRSHISQEKITEELAEWAVHFAVHSFHQALDRQQLEYRAQRDCLTDLANRHTFELEFKNQIKSCESANRNCSLILIDIDHFKNVNDTYGHSAGDEILRQVADVISCSATQFTPHPKTQIARYGGEEFAVLLPGYEIDEAIDIAEQIRKAVETSTMTIPARQVKVTCSIGVSSAPALSDYDPSTLRQKADIALYSAKRSGRNQVAGDQLLQKNFLAD